MSDEPAKVMCCETLYDPYGVWDGFHRKRKPCKNAAKVERDGKPYCGVHDPERVKAKDEKRFAANAAKYAARDREAIRRGLEFIACEGVSDDELRQIIEAGGLAALLAKGGP